MPGYDITMADLQRMCPKLKTIESVKGRYGGEGLLGKNEHGEVLLKTFGPRLNDRLVKTFYNDYRKADQAGLLG